MTRTALKIAATLILCAALYAAADWREVAGHLAAIDVRLLGLALLLFVPQTLVSGWRWRALVRPEAKIGLWEGARHILVASAANLVMPSRLGDFSKAALLPGLDAAGRKRAAAIVVAEKVVDMAVLALAVGVGMLGAQACWIVAAAGGLLCATEPMLKVSNRRRGAALVGGTIVLWSLHLWQLHLFVRCCGVDVPLSTSVERIPAALVAGVLPASFCVIGTRDAALVWLFRDVAPAATMAAVGMLSALRYLIPGAAGIPLWWAGRKLATTATATTSAHAGPSPHRADRSRRTARLFRSAGSEERR